MQTAITPNRAKAILANLDEGGNISSLRPQTATNARRNICRLILDEHTCTLDFETVRGKILSALNADSEEHAESKLRCLANG